MCAKAASSVTSHGVCNTTALKQARDFDCAGRVYQTDSGNSFFVIKIKFNKFRVLKANRLIFLQTFRVRIMFVNVHKLGFGKCRVFSFTIDRQ